IRPTSFIAPMCAMPTTTVENTIGAISIFTSLMNPSPSGRMAAPRSGATNPRTIPAAMPIRTWTYRLFSRRMPFPSSDPEEAERGDAQADERADEREPPEEQRAGQQRDRAEHDRDFETDLRDVEERRPPGDHVRPFFELFVLLA